MFYQMFLSPQEKQSMIIGNKNGIYELPHGLMNNLKLRIFGIKEISQKFQNCMKIWPSAQYNYQIENLVNTSEKLDTELFPWCAILHEI